MKPGSSSARRRGQATIELVMVTPLLLLLILLLLDAATMASAFQTSTAAAEQGARIISLDSSFIQPMPSEEIAARLDETQEISADHDWEIEVKDMEPLSYTDSSGRPTAYQRKAFTVTCIVRVKLPLPLPDIGGITEDGFVTARTSSKSVLAVEEGDMNGGWG